MATGTLREGTLQRQSTPGVVPGVVLYRPPKGTRALAWSLDRSWDEEGLLGHRAGPAQEAVASYLEKYNPE